MFGRLKRNWRWWLVAGMAGLASVSAGFWGMGSRLMRPAHRPVSPPVDLPVVEARLPSRSGATLAAWYVPHPQAAATVVLLHPLRGNRASMLDRARLLHDAGFATVMIDFQAHGESSGNRMTAGYLERQDVQAAVEYARSQNPDHRLGVIGWSLGGAAAVLQSPPDLDAMVLESVYPTFHQAVHNRVSLRIGYWSHLVAPTLLLQLPVRVGCWPRDLRPLDCIDELHCPVLIAAGDQDQHTKLTETKALFAAANEPKKLVVFAGARHQDLLRADPHRYKNSVLPFLIRHLASGPT